MDKRFSEMTFPEKLSAYESVLSEASRLKAQLHDRLFAYQDISGKVIAKELKMKKKPTSYQIFPADEGVLDKQQTKEATRMIYRAITHLVNPTLGNVAEYLGVHRVRLRRMINLLGLADEHKKIKARRQIERKAKRLLNGID